MLLECHRVECWRIFSGWLVGELNLLYLTRHSCGNLKLFPEIVTPLSPWSCNLHSVSARYSFLAHWVMLRRSRNWVRGCLIVVIAIYYYLGGKWSWEFGIINLRIRQHHKSHARKHLMSAQSHSTNLLKSVCRCRLLTQHLARHAPPRISKRRTTSWMEFLRENFPFSPHRLIWATPSWAASTSRNSLNWSMS